jgi:adenosylhomocysteinase
LTELAVDIRQVRPDVDAYTLADGRTLVLLSHGRVVNLAIGEGHPAAVMDVAFADQALTMAWLAENAEELSTGVHEVPAHIDREVAALMLTASGVRLDALSPEQQHYLNSWQYGS